MGALERLAELGLELPAAPPPAAAYLPGRRSGDLLFTAGQLPLAGGTMTATGTVGGPVSLETAVEAARTAALNVLAVAAEASGDLDAVRVVKLTVFVASATSFTDQHLVANGASELIADVLGDAGVHARSAVGVAVLPLDAPVEIEAILELAGRD
jgi:enamine deaminase RidA (YjgF/YER057c/UK114 family)